MFSLSHMDLGTQNILVDHDFNFLSIIDWEFAQTIPWQINHYPMQFPLLNSDEAIREILNDPSHLAYNNMLRQKATQDLHRQKFQSVEKEVEETGRLLSLSVTEALESSASRIYACFTYLGRSSEADEELVYEMVPQAFGFGADEE